MLGALLLPIAVESSWPTTLPILNAISIVGLWGFMSLMVITRKLIWHKDHEAAVGAERRRADKWEGVALRLLGVSEKLTVSAEVANEVLTRLPDPGRTEAGDTA